MENYFIKPSLLLIIMFFMLYSQTNTDGKRGVCANKLTLKEKKLLSPAVSWWYNWYFKGSDMSAKAPMTFIPMVWNEDPEKLAGMSNVLQKGYRPPYIMWCNEPNLKGQAFITPKQAVKSYRETKALASAYNIEVCGPHMALGSAEKDSITAYDPLQKKEITYTYMVPYLDAFYHYAGEENFKYIGVHSYGDINELRWMIGMLTEKYNKPIWVSEFAWWGAKDSRAMTEYMIQAVDLFENSPAVVKYAWFKAHMGEGNRMSLLTEESEELTELGKIYVKLPVHNPDHYFKVPGRIQAEKYQQAHGYAPVLTDDRRDGFLDLKKAAPDNSAEYNIKVSRSGTYTISIRLTGQNVVALQISNKQNQQQTRVRVERLRSRYDTAECSLRLEKGKQTLTVRAAGQEAAVNWYEIE
ncbi:MAG TPA: glycosyl hydrolase [Spirochaetota bacterium]|nr:glycosyl hydrolase [Spirochaetota bacterium]